jgi:hypothetical protein
VIPDREVINITIPPPNQPHDGIIRASDQLVDKKENKKSEGREERWSVSSHRDGPPDGDEVETGVWKSWGGF